MTLMNIDNQTPLTSCFVGKYVVESTFDLVFYIMATYGLIIGNTYYNPSTIDNGAKIENQPISPLVVTIYCSACFQFIYFIASMFYINELWKEKLAGSSCEHWEMLRNTLLCHTVRNTCFVLLWIARMVAVLMHLSERYSPHNVIYSSIIMYFICLFMFRTFLIFIMLSCMLIIKMLMTRDVNGDTTSFEIINIGGIRINGITTSTSASITSPPPTAFFKRKRRRMRRRAGQRITLTNFDDADDEDEGGDEEAHDDNLDECVICMEKMDGESVELRCGHEYHENCVIKWKDQGGTRCPICRREMY